MASTQMASTSTVAFTTSRRNCSARSAPRPSRTTRTVVSALPKQDNARGENGVQRALNAGAKVAVSIAAAQLAILPLSGAALAELAPQVNDNADFGPNEVSKKVIGETSKDANNPFDQAAPGRSGQTFGEAGPGTNEPGAVDPSKAAEKASGIVDKLKDALSFQTLPVFDLAETEAYQNPPEENENADFGPNEVNKKVIEETSVDAGNPFDTAAPGRSGEVFGKGGPGKGDTGAVDESKVKENALKASSVVDKIKSFLPFNTLPVFDLAVAPDAKNLGPNEVGKSDLAKLPGANNKFDTATPGRAGEGSDDILKSGIRGALNRAPEGLKNPKGASDAIKNALGGN